MVKEQDLRGGKKMKREWMVKQRKLSSLLGDSCEAVLHLSNTA